VWVQSPLRWLIGSDQNGAAGSASCLFYTLNSGTTWVTKAFPGSVAGGRVLDIAFASKSVGYLSFETTGGLRCRLLRTINGGATWVTQPDQAGVPVPTVFSLNSIAPCDDDVNFCLVGGAATPAGGSDGYLAVYQ
jgi:photosystem II stability/assembly factor-like uncharacterized protein